MKKDYPLLQLSRKVQAIPEACSVYMNNVVYEMKRRGDKIAVLSLGEAFFEIPRFPLEDNEFQLGYHYSESRGLKELRDIIAKYYTRYGAEVDPDREIIISAGSKPLIFMAFQAVLNPGDEVLIHEPAWLSYPEEIKLADGIPCFIPYDCPVSEFSKYFTEKTRMLVINNPNNPAGRVYSKEELTELYQMCRSRGVYILSDEAYSDFLVDESFTSMSSIVPDKDGVIVVNSLSKNLGISGWRVGYVIAAPEVTFQILKLNQHLVTCASTVLLRYLAKNFDSILAQTLPQAQAVVLKRQAVQAWMDQIGLDYLPGSATFYMFVSTGTYSRSSLDLALYLLMRYHISVVPGSAYGKSTEHFIRISVGAENMETLRTSLSIIKQVIDRDEYDDSLIDTTLSELHMNRFQE